MHGSIFQRIPIIVAKVYAIPLFESFQFIYIGSYFQFFGVFQFSPSLSFRSSFFLSPQRLLFSIIYLQASSQSTPNFSSFFFRFFFNFLYCLITSLCEAVSSRSNTKQGLTVITFSISIVKTTRSIINILISAQYNISQYHCYNKIQSDSNWNSSNSMKKMETSKRKIIFKPVHTDFCDLNNNPHFPNQYRSCYTSQLFENNHRKNRAQGLHANEKPSKQKVECFQSKLYKNNMLAKRRTNKNMYNSSFFKKPVHALNRHCSLDLKLFKKEKLEDKLTNYPEKGRQQYGLQLENAMEKRLDQVRQDLSKKLHKSLNQLSYKYKQLHEIEQISKQQEEIFQKILCKLKQKQCNKAQSTLIQTESDLRSSDTFRQY